MAYSRNAGPPTPRQQRFIDEYLRSNDAVAAARAAGYGSSTVKRNASRLLRVPTIAAAVRAELDVRAERARIAADRIVLELARVAFADIGRIVDWDAKGDLVVRELATLTEADRAAVARVTRHGSHVHIALHDKIRALDALGKYFKLWGKHAEKFAPRTGGGMAPNGDYTNEEQAAARRELRMKIQRILDMRNENRDAREEAAWAAAWKDHYG